MTLTRGERTLEVAQKVHNVLRAHQVPCAAIGAVALAVHYYPRTTEDFDLATDTDPFTRLTEVHDALRRDGFNVQLVTPDADDPLGGTLTVSGDDFDPVQVVNFYNPLRSGNALAREAIQTAAPMAPDNPIPVVDLPHLIALKLYAGGNKSKLDVIELLERNEPLDLESIRSVCRKHRLLDELERILAELQLA